MLDERFQNNFEQATVSLAETYRYEQDSGMHKTLIIGSIDATCQKFE